jgi:nitrite reductase/ring-hydroxylating ferredoxin subunit
LESATNSFRRDRDVVRSTAPLTATLGLPSGWFSVAMSDELTPGRVLTRRFMSEDLVLYRTATGEARATAPYCPHLGAHLGHCGSVEGQTLRCNFHGFHFDREGACVATAYGKRPPPAARLAVKPVVERHGAVFVYHGASGEPPPWDLPEVDFTGWSAPRYSRLSFRGHPQETSENSVDTGHFAVVHGYKSVETVREARTEGPYLNAAYAMTRAFGPLAVRIHLDVHVHGLGYSLVDVDIPAFRLRTRHIVLPTPTDPGHIDMRLALSVKEPATGKLGPLAPLVPTRLVTQTLGRVLFPSFEGDVLQDLPFWENKRYVPRPAIAAGDGPIALYRKWASQFYAP